MDQQLTLGDGTIIANAYALRSGETLILYLEGRHTLEELLLIITSSEKTSSIVAERYETERTYTGYTHPVGLREEIPDGLYTCVLKRENE